MMAPARPVMRSPAPTTELEMTAVPIGPLRPGDQAAAVRQRDFVRGHSRTRSVSPILVDIESEARWVQRLPDAAMCAQAPHEVDRIAPPIERIDKALACAGRATGD